jgi:hypothetical protein
MVAYLKIFDLETPDWEGLIESWPRRVFLPVLSKHNARQGNGSIG